MHDRVPLHQGPKTTFGSFCCTFIYVSGALGALRVNLMVWVLLLVLGAKLVVRQVWWDWVICRVSLLQGPQKPLVGFCYTFVYVGGALGISWGVD